MLIPRIVRSLPQIVDPQIPETIFLAIFLIVALTCIAIHLMQTFFPEACSRLIFHFFRNLLKVCVYFENINWFLVRLRTTFKMCLIFYCIFGLCPFHRQTSKERKNYKRKG